MALYLSPISDKKYYGKAEYQKTTGRGEEPQKWQWEPHGVKVAGVYFNLWVVELPSVRRQDMKLMEFNSKATRIMSENGILSMIRGPAYLELGQVDEKKKKLMTEKQGDVVIKWLKDLEKAEEESRDSMFEAHSDIESD
jgi:hypothetical protein